MICILHGWLLEGSGSNLWTRSIVTALARAGETVHLVCQENHPELYDAISEAYRYVQDGTREQRLKREVPFPGRCIMHQPWIGETVPVFVWDKYDEFARVVPMVELSDDELEAYIDRNVSVVSALVREHGITAIHANHAVLMSVVAERVKRETGIPFAIMPHGSGIEYAVKRDRRFWSYASAAFDDAGKIFVIGDEMRQRVHDVFPDIPGLAEKSVGLHLGVDTSQFDPAPKASRGERIRSLRAALAGNKRGKTAELSDVMISRLPKVKHGVMQEILLDASRYDAKSADAGLEDKLEAIDWSHDPTLLFTGRIISMKGVQAIIAALPLILEHLPNLRLIIVGHGPLREPMEALLWALEHGDRELVRKIVGTGATQLTDVASFLEGLETTGEIDRYFEVATQRVRPANVVFTGYLIHNELRFLFPCCDVGVFPSIVREAGPLVFLEALASGCFPLGTYFGGIAASIDAVASILPREVADVMKLDVGNTVADIADHVPRAFEVGLSYKTALSQIARDRYDWTSVAAVLRRELSALNDR